MLQRDEDVLIIDAKYYEHSMQVQFNKHTLHSANLYQIFTYVKNKEYELREKTRQFQECFCMRRLMKKYIRTMYIR